MEDKFKRFVIGHGSHEHILYLITHFRREVSFVAITRFSGGTFDQNLVVGSIQIFYRTGVIILADSKII